VGRFLTFVAVALGVLGGIHYYIWARLIRDPRWGAPWAIAGGTLLALLALSVPASLILAHRNSGSGRPLIWVGYVWMGVMFLLFTALLASDVVRLGAFLARQRTAVDAERRTFLSRGVAAAITLLVSGAAAVAARSARGPIDVRKLRVRLDRLHPAQDGFTIVQLSDVHVGPTIGRAFIEEIVERTNALHPDLVAITGDLVDGSVVDLGPAIEPLSQLRAPHGVFFVTGNHEYFSGAAPWVAELGRLGIRVLQNERVSIGNGETSFDLAGIEDRSAAHYGGMTPSDAMARAMADRDRSRELVLLAHQPRSWLEAKPYGIGLQLSGHTHGGQIWPFGLVVQLQQPFIAGLYQREASQIYVSRGTGYWGPPMRLGAPPEITEIRLESGQGPTPS
jgi:predicted MPP superfamily phosphohydrolase